MFTLPSLLGFTIGCVLFNTVSGKNVRLPEIDVFTPLSTEASDLCRAQTVLLQKHLESLDIWALRMYDATAKLSSGILNGNVHQLGDYDRCLSIQEEQFKISGKYCLASIHVDVRDNLTSADRNKLSAILDLAQSFNAVPITTDGNELLILPSFSRIHWGLCVPDGCSNFDVEAALSAALSRFNTSLDIRVSIRKDKCDVYKPNKFMNGKCISFMLFLLSVLGIAVAGTFYESYQTDNQGLILNKKRNVLLKVMLAFSFRKNIAELLNREAPPDDIASVHGIRFMVTVVLYLMHEKMMAFIGPVANRTDNVKVLDTMSSLMFREYYNPIDVFVVMSGLLTSYYAIKGLQAGRKLNILGMYLRRYIKFTPLLMLSVFNITHFQGQISKGPIELAVGNHFLQVCDNHWKTLFYIGNIEGVDKMCHPPAHQVMTDMQMYLVAPFLILLLWRYRLRGVLCLTLVVVLLTAYKATVMYYYNVSYTIDHGARMSDIARSMSLMYFNPIHRLTPYTLGVLLGFLLRMSSTNFRLSWGMKAVGWVMAAAAAYFTVLGVGPIYIRGYQFDITTNIIYGSLQPFTLFFVMAWVIFLCHTGQCEFLNKILGWAWFRVFTRISYAFFLLQMLVRYWNLVSVRVPQQMSPYSIDLNELAALLLLSILTTLLFLLPLSDLYKIVAGKDDDAVLEKKSEEQEISNNTCLLKNALVESNKNK